MKTTFFTEGGKNSASVLSDIHYPLSIFIIHFHYKLLDEPRTLITKVRGFVFIRRKFAAQNGQDNTIE